MTTFGCQKMIGKIMGGCNTPLGGPGAVKQLCCESRVQNCERKDYLIWLSMLATWHSYIISFNRWKLLFYLYVLYHIFYNFRVKQLVWTTNNVYISYSLLYLVGVWRRCLLYHNIFVIAYFHYFHMFEMLVCLKKSWIP